MANYKGRDFLLKLGAWSGGVTIGDCRTHSLQINHATVDITNKSSNGYRTLLEAAGTKSATISFGGVMTNDAGFETFQGYANGGAINAYAMAWADGDILEGNFQVTDFQIEGAFDGEQSFTATLQSSGPWTFTPA